jgi:hypothetical protein
MPFHLSPSPLAETAFAKHCAASRRDIVPEGYPRGTSRHESRLQSRSIPAGQAAIDRFGEVTRRTRLYRAHIVPGGYERPMPSSLLLVRVAETPLSLVCLSFTEHEIPREAYSFLDKLATGDFYSPLRLSYTRPFPPPSSLFLKLSRINPPPGVFASPILTRQSSILNLHPQSSILNHQSSITNPSPVVRRPLSVTRHPLYNWLMFLFS